VLPIEAAAREAPTTAIDRGRSSRPMDAASARCSRARITSTERSVGAISNESRTAPDSQVRDTL
jgi:hypothetical protein